VVRVRRLVSLFSSFSLTFGAPRLLNYAMKSCATSACAARSPAPVTERTNIRAMREALRDSLPTLFACLVLLDGLFARRRHADSHVASKGKSKNPLNGACQ
jgi:hypothetical protein